MRLDPVLLSWNPDVQYMDSQTVYKLQNMEAPSTAISWILINILLWMIFQVAFKYVNQRFTILLTWKGRE